MSSSSDLSSVLAARQSLGVSKMRLTTLNLSEKQIYSLTGFVQTVCHRLRELDPVTRGSKDKGTRNLGSAFYQSRISIHFVIRHKLSIKGCVNLELVSGVTQPLADKFALLILDSQRLKQRE